MVLKFTDFAFQISCYALGLCLTELFFEKSSKKECKISVDCSLWKYLCGVHCIGNTCVFPDPQSVVHTAPGE